MHEQFWHDRWQQNQIGFHRDEINSHLQAFWRQLTVPAGSRIFVPLCGKSRDMLWLRSQGFGVTGVEISPIAVHDLFTENQLDPVVTRHGLFDRWEADGLVVLQGNFFDLTAPDVADCAGVFDRASLIALPPDMRPRYAQHFTAILPPHVQTLLVTMEYDQREMSGPPFSVLEDEVASLYRNDFSVERLLEIDILPEEPGFRRRGLSSLTEKVYRLIPR
ncbi:MAG: thiopurine S-methyltransferase [Thiotrichales bacterium]